MSWWCDRSMQQAPATTSADEARSHSGGWGIKPRVGIGAYCQPVSASNMTPGNKFSGFDFQRSAVPSQPSFSPPPRPPPYTTSHPQMSPPSTMPETAVWPSMLITQRNYHRPLLLADPVRTSIRASPAPEARPTSATKPPPRRKVTDEERRQICLEAEQNPHMKQSQIGSKYTSSVQRLC